MNTEQNSDKSEKALRIGGVSGSFLVKKLQWEVEQDKIFGELLIAKVPLPSNDGRARYEIKANNYDNEPKRYYITLFCGNQGHRCYDELWITTKEAAKEYAQGHFRMLIENCLQNEQG